MELTPDEQERIQAIQRVVAGDRPVDIYRNLNRPKKWLNKWVNRYQTGDVDWFKDLPRTPHEIGKRTNPRIESAIIKIRQSLMDKNEDHLKYSFVGAEAIQYQMEQLGYDPSELPSLSTIKRIITRNNLHVNKKERYKRVKSKGRYTIIQPEYIDELHQMDFVGPRHIKGFGAINSLHLKDVVSRQVAGNQYSGKSMDNVIVFLLNYWKHHPIPRYLQTDNGMSFVGDFIHPKSFSRYTRLCLYVGIEVIFIAPAKPWMNGSIEEFNKEFDQMFWKSQTFTSLKHIRAQSKIFYENQNNFNRWREQKKKSPSFIHQCLLPKNFRLNSQHIPLVTGKIHFIRIVGSNGDIVLMNEIFHVGNEYIGEYVWATIDTGKQTLAIHYNDENMLVQKIVEYDYLIDEPILNLNKRFIKNY